MKWWHVPLLTVNLVLWFYLATFAFSYYVSRLWFGKLLNLELKPVSRKNRASLQMLEFPKNMIEN